MNQVLSEDEDIVPDKYRGLVTEQYRGENEAIKLFHGNSIEVLEKNYGGVFKEDRVLLSLRNINTIILLDLEKKEIVWSTDKNINLDRPHNPTMTKEGNVLIFDNGWETRNFSRVIEVDEENNIVWEYEDGENFYSQFMGGAQELSNGNILITESMEDKAFEVDRQGEIVWEFDVGDNRPYFISRDHSGIFRFTRLDQECIDRVLEGNLLHSRQCR